MFERLDERSRQVLDLAQQHARELGHNYLGTEHLLYGLSCSGGIVACRTQPNVSDPPKARTEATL